jgi:hypothetical protein
LVRQQLRLKKSQWIDGTASICAVDGGVA